MAITVNDSRMYALLYLYDMHTAYLGNVLEGISDQDAHQRLNTKANHIAWLTGSLVHERFELAGTFGKKQEEQAAALFMDHKGIQDNVQYPGLSVFKKDWEKISPVLRKQLENLSEEELDKPFDMPGPPMTCFDLVAFMMYREANCIGQIALWRRLLGYPPMRYM